ncbi:Alpha/Beta hydrolase protein [Mycena maculata]|uniref:Alpha/Beta hydrolase protein n=1 Tax=Mycena maculata TaxID=230809 RepID=A0AAD7HV08_9AGAR|nr:Alpha/Beta hydrolase protein [Mycena maculata]
MSRITPYGNWTSPISAQVVAAQSHFAGIEEVILDPATSKVYFTQKRPEENGRSAAVDAFTGQDIFDQAWDARTHVHEYGGGAATVFDGVLYFSHLRDGRVYKANKGNIPVAITPVNTVQRFADFAVHPKQPDLIVCTVEDHTDPHPLRVSTYLVVINSENMTVSKLVEGADFYACARFSPDGEFIVWQQWHHPELPWQSAEIMLASVTIEGKELNIGNPVQVAGKTEVVAAQDPNWASNNTIFFTCDISGYHNPWKFVFDPADPAAGKASPILREPIKEEFGPPQWFLSRHSSGALSETKVAFVSFFEGRSVLYICDLVLGTIRKVATSFAHIQFLRGDGRGKVVMLGQPADAGEILMELTLDGDGNPQMKSLSPPAVENPSLPSSFISTGQYFALTLPPDNRTCHINYYPPKNPNYDGGVPGEKPPVVVLIHGGPFYMETANLEWTKQFWTSRGWAQIDLNYGGSTGFGRAFRESIHGKWGVLDIEDAHQTVLQLDALGYVDARRAVVHGSSAGGYAVLQIATTLPTAFQAGAPHYGLSDMRKLDEVLHKFEYYLCDRLMGGTWEECEPVWRARSPIYHVDKITMPLLILQGEEDTVIPAEQMIEMVRKIKERKGKADIVLFPGEGHGWRKASTMRTVLEREMSFFNKVLGLENTHGGEVA